MKKKKDIGLILKKIAKLENCSTEDILKRHKYYFGKYNITVSKEDVEKFKSNAIKSVRNPFKIEKK